VIGIDHTRLRRNRKGTNRISYVRIRVDPSSIERKTASTAPSCRRSGIIVIPGIGRSREASGRRDRRRVVAAVVVLGDGAVGVRSGRNGGIEQHGTGDVPRLLLLRVGHVDGQGIHVEVGSVAPYRLNLSDSVDGVGRRDLSVRLRRGVSTTRTPPLSAVGTIGVGVGVGVRVRCIAGRGSSSGGKLQFVEWARRHVLSGDAFFLGQSQVVFCAVRIRCIGAKMSVGAASP